MWETDPLSWSDAAENLQSNISYRVGRSVGFSHTKVVQVHQQEVLLEGIPGCFLIPMLSCESPCPADSSLQHLEAGLLRGSMSEYGQALMLTVTSLRFCVSFSTS